MNKEYREPDFVILEIGAEAVLLASVSTYIEGGEENEWGTLS